MKTKQFSFRDRAHSFRYAWQGIYTFFAREHNAWIHLAASIAVFIAAWYFRVSSNEMILLIIVTGFVWVAEIFNTAIEKLADFVSPGYHPRIKLVKDLSAAAVLVASFISLVTGVLIFIPKFL